jgi:crotonobetainyl-CoA:carnitine CoA-transferase CaiB-like acyl-CoA transferase
VRVVEFTHMVMGPTCGMILADLGAEVIKVEPLAGDNTRKLLGSGAGFFSMFNRNKKSLAVDVKDPRGREIVLRWWPMPMSSARTSRPARWTRLGLGAPVLRG